MRSVLQSSSIIEFLFEIIREKDEPVVAVIELVKAVLKIKEYHQLITKERSVNTYLEPDSYRELCLFN